MGRTKKAVFKNLLPRDLSVITRKAEVMREIREQKPVLKSLASRGWFLFW
jgi:hypothetical protein